MCEDVIGQFLGWGKGLDEGVPGGGGQEEDGA